MTFPAPDGCYHASCSHRSSSICRRTWPEASPCGLRRTGSGLGQCPQLSPTCSSPPGTARSAGAATAAASVSRRLLVWTSISFRTRGRDPKGSRTGCYFSLGTPSSSSTCLGRPPLSCRTGAWGAPSLGHNCWSLGRFHLITLIDRS